MDERFEQTSLLLKEHPKMGKPGSIIGTRELLAHRNYRLIYEIRDDAIWILALVHTARMWPPLNAA